MLVNKNYKAQQKLHQHHAVKFSIPKSLPVRICIIIQMQKNASSETVTDEKILLINKLRTKYIKVHRHGKTHYGMPLWIHILKFQSCHAKHCLCSIRSYRKPTAPTLCPATQANSQKAKPQSCKGSACHHPPSDIFLRTFTTSDTSRESSSACFPTQGWMACTCEGCAEG